MRREGAEQGNGKFQRQNVLGFFFPFFSFPATQTGDKVERRAQYMCQNSYDK